jgi:hypothetical protein
MALNRWTTRDRVWGKKGQHFANAMLKLKPLGFLLVAIMNNKSAVKYEVISGIASKQAYQDLLDHLFDRALEQYPLGPNLIVVNPVVGNQTKQMMLTTALNRGLQILLLPLYSSPLNPL